MVYSAPNCRRSKCLSTVNRGIHEWIDYFVRLFKMIAQNPVTVVSHWFVNLPFYIQIIQACIHMTHMCCHGSHVQPPPFTWMYLWAESIDWTHILWAHPKRFLKFSLMSPFHFIYTNPKFLYLFLFLKMSYNFNRFYKGQFFVISYAYILWAFCMTKMFLYGRF